MLSRSDHDRLDRLERAIVARLMADDDAEQVAKDLNAPLPLVQCVLMLPDF